jgi:predicted RNA-binding protein with PIN domain
MVIVIDAYNVLKQKSEHVTQEAQKHFINSLVTYAQRKENDIVVVFDGGPHHWPSEKKMGAVTIIYSGARLNADEIIKQCLNVCEPHNTALVSSDRELGAYASARGVASVDSIDFMRLLESPVPETIVRIVKSKQPAIKQRSGPATEFDKLMEKASQIVLYKEEDMDVRPAPKKSGQTASKREKKLERVVKKL